MLQCLCPDDGGGLWKAGIAAARADDPPAASAAGPAPSLPPPPMADAPAAAADPRPAAPAPATPASPTAPAASTGGASTAEPGKREDQFRDLERRTFELKDQVFRSKARLTLLSETLVSTNVGTTRAIIVHKNQMGRLFQPIRVSYQIDGREVFSKDDPAGVNTDGKELVVWDSGVKPGEHTVGVTVVYRGNGAKVLSYYDKFTYTARAAHRLTTTEGQTTRLVVRCFEKGNVLTARIEDRPEFEFKVAGDGPRAESAPAAKSTPASPTEVKAK
jgi:hypothetical protein